MVGSHQVNHPLAEASPQPFAIFMAPNWRSAFAKRRSIGDRFRRQVQIMRACFDADRKALRARFTQLVQRLGSCQMYDMQAKVIFSAE